MDGDRGGVMGGKVRGEEGAEGPQQGPGPKGPLSPLQVLERGVP